MSSKKMAKKQVFTKVTNMYRPIKPKIYLPIKQKST